MKKMILGLYIVGMLSFTCAGCAPLIIGGVIGAVGGYAASEDTIQGETDKSYDLLWDAALQVSAMKGIIKTQDPAAGSIMLGVGTSTVWIKLVRLTMATTRVKVSSRKHHLPNLNLAQEIFVKIMELAQ